MKKMIKPVIKWSGSKRSQSEKIKSFLPDSYDTYFEPFIGGGSMLYAINPENSICGDICEPLIALWKEIRDNPQKLAEGYRERWTRLQEEGYTRSTWMVRAFYRSSEAWKQTESRMALVIKSGMKATSNRFLPTRSTSATHFFRRLIR